MPADHPLTPDRQAAEKLIGEVRAKLAKATPGPWRCDIRVGCVGVYEGEKRNCLATGQPFVHYVDGYKNEQGDWRIRAQDLDNATLIASAPSDLAALCDALSSALADVERFQQRAANISQSQANELQDVLRTLTDSGTALLTSARELVQRKEHAEADVERLTRERDEAKRRSLECICVWCGTVLPRPLDPAESIRVMFDHAKGCDKRPENRLTAELEQAEAALSRCAEEAKRGFIVEVEGPPEGIVKALACHANELRAALSRVRAEEREPEVRLGVIEFHPKAALRERFYAVVNDLRAAGAIVDLWLMDIATVLREHGYTMTIRRGLQPSDAPAAQEGWQPIETAPKDGRAVILVTPAGAYQNGIAYPEMVGMGWFVEQDALNGPHWAGGCGLHPRCYPTHWMPLPDAPKVAQPEADAKEQS